MSNPVYWINGDNVSEGEWPMVRATVGWGWIAAPLVMLLIAALMPDTKNFATQYRVGNTAYLTLWTLAIACMSLAWLFFSRKCDGSEMAVFGTVAAFYLVAVLTGIMWSALHSHGDELQDLHTTCALVGAAVVTAAAIAMNGIDTLASSLLVPGVLMSLYHAYVCVQARDPTVTDTIAAAKTEIVDQINDVNKKTAQVVDRYMNIEKFAQRNPDIHSADLAGLDTRAKKALDTIDLQLNGNPASDDAKAKLGTKQYYENVAAEWAKLDNIDDYQVNTEVYLGNEPLNEAIVESLKVQFETDQKTYDDAKADADDIAAALAAASS